MLSTGSTAFAFENNHLRKEVTALRAENEALKVEALQWKTILECTELKLAKCQKEVEEQARLNGMGSQREAKLLAEIDRLKRERDSLLRGEYICKRCGLRKDSEQSANHDF